MSAGLSLLAVGLGTLIPLSAAAIPLWLLYGVITGTIAMGCWVIAHECGHHAFHPNRRIEGVVGFVLHSILLVPYYSWAHSHAVHHAHCNHLEQGETHVPPRATSPMGRTTEQLKQRLNPTVFGIISLFNHLVIGWQLYLFLGATGGEDYDSPPLISGIASAISTANAAFSLSLSASGCCDPTWDCSPWLPS